MMKTKDLQLIVNRHTTPLVLSVSARLLRGQATNNFPTLQPIPIPRDAHDVMFISQKLAICAPKAIPIVKPIE